MTPQLSSVERDRSEFDGEGDATIGPNARLIQPELEWFSPPLCESVPIIPNSQVILARWAMPESPYPVELSSCCSANLTQVATVDHLLRTSAPVPQPRETGSRELGEQFLFSRRRLTDLSRVQELRL